MLLRQSLFFNKNIALRPNAAGLFLQENSNINIWLFTPLKSLNANIKFVYHFAESVEMGVSK